MYFTNSIIPPSYLCIYSFGFLFVLSIKLIDTPLLRKASSLILFSKIVGLNLIEENTAFEGKKLIFVPFFFCFSDFFKWFY